MRNLVLPLIIVCLSVAVVGCGPSDEQKRAQARTEWKQQMSKPVDSGGVVAATNK